MTRNRCVVYAQGYPKEYVNKDKRSLSWSPYQYVPYYIMSNEVLNVSVLGETKEKVFAVIGLPSDNKNKLVYELTNGNNSLQVKVDGILSFVNNNESDDVIIEIESNHQKIPFFKLHENTNAEFFQEMEEYAYAKFVILSNNSTDIIVTYPSAKKYIKAPKELMENYEFLINVENRVMGLRHEGKADYKLDPNRNLYIEVDTGYMYATSEYTGYCETSGAMPQLLGASNKRWGVWHENGHQRQQHPWQWSSGTGLTEVTTNIFSLSVQEALFGKASRIDEEKFKIEQFVSNNDPNKSYDNQNLFLKLGLFWQLKLAFGDSFYPQLHQCYRLMNDTPKSSEHHEQKQLFIRTVSKLVNINLLPFFSKWGIESDLETIRELYFLPPLTQPIWENTNDNYHFIEMPEPIYIPEMRHIKNSISNVIITETKISFIINKDWYSPYHYYFRLNGVYLGEINKGINYYCSVRPVASGFMIIINMSRDKYISRNDVFSIEVILEGKHIICQTTMKLNELWSDVKNIYFDESLTVLKTEINQHELDALWGRYNELKNDSNKEIRNKIILAQQLLLMNTIKNDSYDGVNYTVEFDSLSFNYYTYTVTSNSHILSELKNGEAKAPSTLDGCIWKIPVNPQEYSDFYLSVNMHNHEFIIKVGFVEGFLLHENINSLYSDKENMILKESVNQAEIDDIKTSISTSKLPFWKKQSLNSYLDNAQCLYLTNTISETYMSNNRFHVNFCDNDLFRNYRYMLFSDSNYLSEITYGQCYYSFLDRQTWRTDIKQYEPSSLRIKAYVNDKWHLIYIASENEHNIANDGHH